MPHPVSPAASAPEQDDGLPAVPALSENGSQQSEEGRRIALIGEDQMDMEIPARSAVNEGVCLDNMFDDDDEDDAFPASSAPETKPKVAIDVPMCV